MILNSARIIIVFSIICCYLQREVEKDTSHYERKTNRTSMIYDNKNKDKVNTIFMSDEIAEMLLLLYEFFKKNSRSEIFLFDILLMPNCTNSLYDTITKKDKILAIIEDTGKNINDLGSSTDCLENNLTYFYLKFETTPDFLNISSFKDVLSFNSKSKFFVGFCILPSCDKFYDDFLNKSLNKPFFDFLENYSGITNVERIAKVKNSEKLESEEYKYNCDFLFYILSSILLFMLISKNVITFIGNIYFSYFIEDKIKDNFIDSDFSHYLMTEQESIQNIIMPSGQRTQLRNDSRGEIYSYFKYLSIKKDLNRLCKLKNNYYNDTDFTVLNGIKTILLFMMIFNENFFTLSIIPNRFTGSYRFYQSFLLSFVKYSTFSFDCYIGISAFQFIFKLMTYLKKYKKKNFILFLKFYMNCLSKMILFYIIFFNLYYCSINIAQILGGELFFKYLYDLKIQNLKCIEQPWTVFIPFNNIFFSQSEDYCFLHFELLTSEFYCMTIMTIIVYFSFLFKKKLFDNIITVIAFLLGLSTSLSFKKLLSNDKTYDIDIFLGETETLSKPYIMLYTYFIGFLSGLSYYYYCDIVRDYSYKAEEGRYIPFRICYYYMQFLDQISKLTYLLLFFISITIQVLLSISFTIILYTRSEHYKNILSIKMNLFHKLLFIYEKKIFIIGFIIMVSLLVQCNKSNTLINIFSGKLFILVSRLNFCILCISKGVTYIFYSMYNIQIYINYTNLILNTFGLSLILIFISFLLVILFELPFRYVFKRCTKEEKIKQR